ncbi:MAG: DNA polymerase III subunit alpha [Lachnospiraceae bacterium]|nr:DNA polymerase III subunit alpha [Lachnospiraceae bacterium]
MFTHLHTHTEYSLLDGSNKIKNYIKRVKELGMTAAAITDHGVMYGCIEFYKEARKQGIKPILGCEVYVAPNSRFDKETTGGEDRYYHLILLAENNTGYANLIKIVSAGHVEGFYYKPRVDMEILNKYHEGLICLSACLAGEVQRYLAKGMYEEACKQAIKYRDCFGENNYFLELQDHGIPEQANVNHGLMRMSQELNIPLVCTNDCHYTYEDDVEAHDLLLCMQTGKKVIDEDRMRYEGGQYYVKSEEEMLKLFGYFPEALENTNKIADRCNVTIEFNNYKLPHYDVPREFYDYEPPVFEGCPKKEDYTPSWRYFSKLCWEGLERRYGNYSDALKKQMEHELRTISNMGFVDYFLIVWDYVNYAKSHGIAVGPGRGSAAGSIVAYSLAITDIDPVKYDLLFERFLNPERVSMPDIDMDFAPEGRQDVINYVMDKYGHEKVVQIIAFGTMQAKGAIKSVVRVLDKPVALGNELAKMVPEVLNISIDDALNTSKELKERYVTDEEVKYIIDMSRRLEGLPNHTTIHAAGVLICPEAADEYIPLARGKDDVITTQFEKTTVEELGLLKMDFLGLQNLTIIQDAISYIKDSRGIDIDINNIDYEDEEVYASIGTGRTDGVFQLESAGMKGFMKRLQPKNLDDIIAGIALFRPGPMDFIPQYIRAKNSPELVTYRCPELEPILKSTYGCIVYQEQVMQIVQDLGGYTLGRADLVRRAMSKKHADEMEEERNNFVYGNPDKGVPGCAAKGISPEVANAIFDDMQSFASYAFNKSHSAAYAFVTYQTAYLKCHYPTEYMAALMTSAFNASDKVSQYIYSCKQMGLEILPPDINKGYARFSVSGNSIRYGLASIKGVGWGVIDAVVAERTASGKYRDLEDFITRLSSKEVNKGTIEGFIKAGAFDCFNATRKQMLCVYTQILDQINKDRKHTVEGQMSLFDFASEEDKVNMQIKMPDVGEFDKEELLSYEKEVLGIYVSGHPMEEYEGLWRKNITNMTSDFVNDNKSEDDSDNQPGVTGIDDEKENKVKDGERVVIGGLVTSRVLKQTKKGDVYARVIVEDLVGMVECLVWPRQYEKYSNQLVEGSKIFVEGRAQADDDKDAIVICDKITAFTDIPRKLWIQFETMDDYEAKAKEIMDTLKTSDGNDDVIIYIKSTKQKKVLPKNQSVNAGAELIEKLSKMFGNENVRVTV